MNKGQENRVRADALSRELNRAENTLNETRGLLLMAAGYVRSQQALGYTPSGDELDFVAFTIEAFGERLQDEHGDLSKAAGLAMSGLDPMKPGKVQPPPRHK